jgi:hypothetical protein
VDAVRSIDALCCIAVCHECLHWVLGDERLGRIGLNTVAVASRTHCVVVQLSGNRIVVVRHFPEEMNICSEAA